MTHTAESHEPEISADPTVRARLELRHNALEAMRKALGGVAAQRLAEQIGAVDSVLEEYRAELRRLNAESRKYALEHPGRIARNDPEAKSIAARQKAYRLAINALKGDF